MLVSAYFDMAQDSSGQSRENERLAFSHSIELMRLAETTGRGSREFTDALHFIERLWTILMSDLAEDSNALPVSLKASLLSVGIWVLRRVGELRDGQCDSFSALIEVSDSIRGGLVRLRQ